MPVAVLHVVTDPRRRGAQAFAYELHRELQQRGHESDIVALAGEGDLDIPVLGPTRMNVRTLSALRRRSEAAQVVVAHGSTTLPACGLALKKTPFIYVNIGDPRHWTGTRLSRARTGAMMRKAVAVAPVSPQAVDILIERFRLDPDRITPIPNGRSPVDFLPPTESERAQARADLGIPGTARAVIGIGALSPEKRWDLAIEAFVHSRADLFLIAGDGPLRETLEVPENVRLLGTLDKPLPLYHAADAIILASDSEGVPGVLVEAALCAVPAVATDVGFVRDVVRDGETGILVPPGDAKALTSALDLVTDSRYLLGVQALRHTRNRFAMSGVVDAWERLLERVAHKSASD